MGGVVFGALGFLLAPQVRGRQRQRQARTPTLTQCVCLALSLSLALPNVSMHTSIRRSGQIARFWSRQ